jgi:hypothetical protein
VPESGPLGFVRGALSNERPYRDLSKAPAESTCISCRDSHDRESRALAGSDHTVGGIEQVRSYTSTSSAALSV